MPGLTSSALSQYFTLMVGASRASSPTEHVSHGADCVSPADLAGLRFLLPQVRLKAAQIIDSNRLRRRLELLALYLETTPTTDSSPSVREAAFVLYYFLRGYDMIPDSIPEVGLLDDALLVETAFNRNQHELRAHWAAQGWAWPEAV